MAYLSSTPVSSKHYTITPAAVSRQVQDTLSSLRLSQEKVRQGCILSPFLYFIMWKAMNHPGFGIGWKNDRRLTDLDFADNIALAAEEDHVCQEMTTNLAEHSAKFGLHISQEKTKVIRTNHTSYVRLPANLQRTGTARMFSHFTYLGRVIRTMMLKKRYILV